MRLGIGDSAIGRIAQAVQQQQGLQIIDASPVGEDEVYYFSDDIVLVVTNNAWDDPDEGPMWLVLTYNPDGTQNTKPEPYLEYLRQQYSSGSLPSRKEPSQEDTEWIARFREDIPELKEQYDAQKREQHEQEGEQLDQPENVRF